MLLTCPSVPPTPTPAVGSLSDGLTATAAPGKTSVLGTENTRLYAVMLERAYAEASSTAWPDAVGTATAPSRRAERGTA